jgi:DNA-binding LacI/PurR family transcriptional regulator
MDLTGGPLYQQIVDQLSERIESGAYGAGEKLPSERALCDEFDVSQITVRRALRELAHLGRVYSRHGLGWYVCEATSLGARPQVALVMGGNDSLLFGLLQGCATALADQGIHAQVLFCRDGEAGVREMRGLLNDLAPKAVLWGVAGREQELAARYGSLVESNGAPALLFPRQIEGLDLPAIALDEGAGVAQVTAHLMALGHLRIAYVGGDPSLAEGWRRYWGFAAAIWEKGLELPLDWILAAPEGEPIAQERLEALFGGAQRPSAVVCATDTLAAEVMHRLGALGLPCPEQVAIAGLGDEPFGAYLSTPLTTFRLDREGWAGALAEAARALLAGRTPETRVLSGELVIRASCGARPA